MAENNIPETVSEGILNEFMEDITGMEIVPAEKEQLVHSIANYVDERFIEDDDEMISYTESDVEERNNETGEIIFKSNKGKSVATVPSAGKCEVTLTAHIPRRTQDWVNAIPMELKGDVNNTDSSDPTLDNPASTGGTFDTCNPTSTSAAPAKSVSNPVTIANPGQVLPAVVPSAVVTPAAEVPPAGVPPTDEPSAVEVPPADEHPAAVSPAAKVPPSADEPPAGVPPAGLPPADEPSPAGIPPADLPPAEVDEWPEDYHKITLEQYARMTVTKRVVNLWDPNKKDKFEYHVQFEKSE